MPRPVEDLVASLASFETLLAGWETQKSIGMPRPQWTNTASTARKLAEKVRNALAVSTQRASRRLMNESTATTPFVVKAANLSLRGSARDVAAFEMRLAGVYEAARREPGYPVVAIRGISDIVGLRRDSAWTRYACNAAASFCVTLLHQHTGFVSVGAVQGAAKQTSSSPPTAASPIRGTAVTAQQGLDGAGRSQRASDAASSGTDRLESRGELNSRRVSRGSPARVHITTDGRSGTSSPIPMTTRPWPMS